MRKSFLCHDFPESKVHGANMGPICSLSVPDGPHVGPMNLAIRAYQDQVIYTQTGDHLKFGKRHSSSTASQFWNRAQKSFITVFADGIAHKVYRPSAGTVPTQGFFNVFRSLTILNTFSSQFVTDVAICDGKCRNLWQRQNMQFNDIYSLNFDKYFVLSSYLY